MHSFIAAGFALLAATAAAAPGKPSKSFGGSNSVPNIDLSCRNAGFSFSVYKNGSAWDSPNDQAWDPKSLDSQRPFYSGVRQTIGINVQGLPCCNIARQDSIYGSPQIDTNHFAIKHTGYVFAAVAGSYKFALGSTDDATHICAGSDCLTPGGPTYQLNQYFTDPAISKSIAVDAGYYIPFQVRYANVLGGNYDFDLTITDPSGNVLLSNNAPSQTSVVGKLCKSSCKTWTKTGLQ